MVTQVLSGISATEYTINKISNDGIFRQTIASVLGYDSKLEDINIQQVADVATAYSHSHAAAAVETKITYSITTPTRIFNDADYAITMFIQALNESIVTGAFDAKLHMNAGTTDLQAVTTDSVIFSTASPTSTPTSVPTLSPTKKDIVAASIFEIPLDNRVAKAKIQYYLGTFVGYFLSIFTCLYLYSFLRYGKSSAAKLYDNSYQSKAYIRNSASTSSVENKPKNGILLDLFIKNEQVQGTMLMDEKLKAVKQAASKADVKDVPDYELKYSKGYREYVQQQRTLLGCTPSLYPDGYTVKIPCISKEIHLPPGRVENLLLYICHNHPLFSCFYFMDGSKLGAHGARILYISKDVVVFVLYQFSNMLLQYCKLDGIGLGTFINLFIITPSAVSVGFLLKYLYICPFTESIEFQRKYARYQSIVVFLGRMAIVPIVLVMCGSLIIACLFSSNRHVPMILVNFFLCVQVYGIILAVIKAALLFVDDYHYNLSLFGVMDIICIGRLYKERIMVEPLVVDVDYAYRINKYLFGLVKVHKILNRDDAIKAKWITEVATSSSSDDHIIEMMRGGNNDFVVLNPLAAAKNSSADDEESVYTTMAASNPIFQHVNNSNHNHQESLRLELSAVNNTCNVPSEADDDVALYLEYQNLQSRHDDSVYDMTADAEVAISFEEWKTNKKQFKQGSYFSASFPIFPDSLLFIGTRGSFVKAFQVFEEREHSARGHLEQSASVQNTLHLHRNNVKNVLAATTMRPK